MKKLILIALIAGFFLQLKAQEKDSYRIELKFQNIADSILYMANYYGDKTYLADTAYSKGDGVFVFQKSRKPEGGLYIIVNQQKKSMFEFLVSDSRQMKFEINGNDFVKDMRVFNSRENELFFQYLNFSGDLYAKVKPLNDRLKVLPANSDSAEILKSEVKSINNQMIDYKENIMQKYPQTFLAAFFALLKEIPVPDTLPVLPDGSRDSTYPYKYYKAHFWDYTHLNDDRLVRTPLFHKKVDTYFDQVVAKSPDSIVYEIDRLLSKMNETGDMYKFTLWHLTIKFDESQIMGHDAILVHLSDAYFSKGKASWLNADVVKNIQEEANKRRNTLLGELAPNLIMLDTNQKPRSLHELKNDYVVLFFWDPNCGHCKKETPKIVDFYDNFAKELNVEVFAVCADTNMVEMKKYIKQKKMNFVNVNGPRAYTSDYHDLYNIFSTPVIIVLDKNKRIIAKRLAGEQLKEFIENHRKYSELEKSTPPDKSR